jgi:hypothetical protein
VLTGFTRIITCKLLELILWDHLLEELAFLKVARTYVMRRTAIVIELQRAVPIRPTAQQQILASDVFAM